MKRWLNFKHLKDANTTYWAHAYYSLKEAVVLLIWSLLSIVHAFIPWLFDFQLLIWRIDQIIELHKFIPQHPAWDDLKKKINDQ
jgi:hypothetical protein